MNSDAHVVTPAQDRILKFVLIVLFGIPITGITIGVAILVGTALYDDYVIRPRYFAAHPLIADLDDAISGTGGEARAREVVLTLFPRGSSPGEVHSRLEKEQFDCAAVHEQRQVHCPFAEDWGYLHMRTDWWLAFQFDMLGRLTDAKVQGLSISP
jgi:hypothetical protein